MLNISKLNSTIRLKKVKLLKNDKYFNIIQKINFIYSNYNVS